MAFAYKGWALTFDLNYPTVKGRRFFLLQGKDVVEAYNQGAAFFIKKGLHREDAETIWYFLNDFFTGERDVKSIAR